MLDVGRGKQHPTEFLSVPLREKQNMREAFLTGTQFGS